MEKGDSPSLVDRIGTPLFFLALGLSALAWFVYRFFSLFHNVGSQVIVFDKGAYYFFGSGIGLLTLAYMIIKEFWFKKPLTKKQSSFFSGLAVLGVILMFVFPQVAHFAADNYLVKHGYDVCDEASHQWLFVRDIVYIRPPLECSEGLPI